MQPLAVACLLSCMVAKTWACHGLHASAHTESHTEVGRIHLDSVGGARSAEFLSLVSEQLGSLHMACKLRNCVTVSGREM